MFRWSMQQICSVISDSIIDKLCMTGNACTPTMIISVDILHAKAPHKEDRMYPPFRHLFVRRLLRNSCYENHHSNFPKHAKKSYSTNFLTENSFGKTSRTETEEVKIERSKKIKHSGMNTTKEVCTFKRRRTGSNYYYCIKISVLVMKRAVAINLLKSGSPWNRFDRDYDLRCSSVDSGYKQNCSSLRAGGKPKPNKRRECSERAKCEDIQTAVGWSPQQSLLAPPFTNLYIYTEASIIAGIRVLLYMKS